MEPNNQAWREYYRQLMCYPNLRKTEFDRLSRILADIGGDVKEIENEFQELRQKMNDAYGDSHD